ncbi:MAG: hypothetical protein PHF67_05245 [Candidatus Nanoarchaeia archaeon]|nr:hypothetical protein [Candidatus Nanoarchaeia archaeon]
MNVKTTLTKGTIIRPTSPILEVSSTQKIDYMGVINNILSIDPNNRVNSNSLLYRLALKQWFSQVKGTKDRKPLPTWFCGWPGSPPIFTNINGAPYFLNPPTTPSLLITTEVVSPFVTGFDVSLSSVDVSTISSILCADDVCLDYGLPGSFGYAFCSGSIVELGISLDWSNAFYSVLDTALGTLSSYESSSEENGYEGDGNTYPIPASDKFLTAFLLPASNERSADEKDGYTNSMMFFADYWNNTQRESTINYLKSIGSNCITMLLVNKDGPVTPYKNGNFGGEFDTNKLNDWVTWFKKLNDNGLSPIPMWMCDESSPWSNENNSEHARCIQKLTEVLDEYVGMWIVGLEVSEYWSPSYTNAIAGEFKKYTSKKVGVHNQGTDHAKGNNLDFLALECYWNPWEGGSFSTDEVFSIVQQSITEIKKSVILAEYNVRSNTEHAKQQGRAGIAAGAIGAWNGF